MVFYIVYSIVYSIEKFQFPTNGKALLNTIPRQPTPPALDVSIPYERESTSEREEDADILNEY